MAHQDEGISVEALEQELAALRRRLSNAEAQRAAAEQEIRKIRGKRRYFAQLLALRQGNREPNTSLRVPADFAEKSSNDSPLDGVLRAVHAELLKAGRPLHISDLMRLLTDQGTRIPGAGSQANLISCIRRDERIVRPSRGMYGLASWGLSEMARKPSGRRKRHRLDETVRRRGPAGDDANTE